MPEIVRHHAADPDCDACHGVGWLVMRRDIDDRDAVERCDECFYYEDDNDPRNVWDTDVAPLAIRSGIDCETTYPCYVKGAPAG
jgi:hypothetical protein